MVLVISSPGRWKDGGGWGAYVKIFRLTVKGRGMMRSMNKAISATRSMNTWKDLLAIASAFRQARRLWESRRASFRQIVRFDEGTATYQCEVERHLDVVVGVSKGIKNAQGTASRIWLKSGVFVVDKTMGGSSLMVLREVEKRTELAHAVTCLAL